MATIFYSNILPFFCLMGLFYIQRKNTLFDQKQGKLFRYAIYINMTLLVVISFDYLFYHELSWIPNVWMIHRVTSCINFAASPIILVLIYFIFTEQRGKKWFYVPCILNVILCFSSIFTNDIFEITVENTYHRGSLFMLPFITTIFYLCVLIAYAGRTKSLARTGKVSERILLIAIILVLTGAMTLEVKFGFMFLTWDAASLGLIMYYLLININNSSLDPLTQSYNRAMYMAMLSEIDRSKACSFALLDINDFKAVNDSFGHIAGDEFLIQFCLILQRGLDKSTNLYRVGGDEFAVISKEWELEQLCSYLDESKELMKKENMFFSYGAIKYQPDQILDDMLEQADEKMYEEKKKNRHKSVK